jgi:hypothetical protein
MPNHHPRPPLNEPPKAPPAKPEPTDGWLAVVQYMGVTIGTVDFFNPKHTDTTTRISMTVSKAAMKNAGIHVGVGIYEVSAFLMDTHRFTIDRMASRHNPSGVPDILMAFRYGGCRIENATVAATENEDLVQVKGDISWDCRIKLV